MLELIEQKELSKYPERFTFGSPNGMQAQIEWYKLRYDWAKNYFL